MGVRPSRQRILRPRTQRSPGSGGTVNFKEWLHDDVRQWRRRRGRTRVIGTFAILRGDISSSRYLVQDLLLDVRRDRQERHHARLIRRYVGPGGRYLHLLALVYIWPRPRQKLFQWRLRWSARRASIADLTQLLDKGGWREHLAVSWLIASGRREDMRDRIELDLLGTEPCGYGWDYCVALARLGTERDAELLCSYLDLALLRRDQVDAADDDEEGHYCEASAMGALLYLDQVHGTDKAGRFLAAGGPWDRRYGYREGSMDRAREDIARYVAFAAGQNPGFRQHVARRIAARGIPGIAP